MKKSSVKAVIKVEEIEVTPSLQKKMDKIGKLLFGKLKEKK